MSETVNIGVMAELLSRDVFAHFGWKISGPTNENYECIVEGHDRKKHPADVVFSYHEPYEDRITHILCDLKSYSRDSIRVSEIKKALENLNESLTCARKNIDWNTRYVFTEKHVNVKGMLFIYNHDNEYDKDFYELFKKATEKFSVDRGNVISVLGPQKIRYLSNMCWNIERLRGRRELPGEESCGFYYPEQAIRKIFPDPSRLPLTVEQVGGSFHIHKYTREVEGNVASGLDVYMEAKENEFENFQHLFDFLRKYNCLQTVSRVRVFVPFSKPATHIHYSRALSVYEQNVDSEFAGKLAGRISYEHMHVVTPQFFSQEIGMRNE